MRVPGMRHGAVVLAAHPRARVLAIDAGAGARDGGRGAGAHRGRRAGRAVRRVDRQGLAGVRCRGGDDALRRRRAGARRRRHPVPRTPGREGGAGRGRGAAAGDLPRGGAGRGRARDPPPGQPPRGDGVRPRRRGRGAGGVRARRLQDVHDAADRARLPGAGGVPGRARGERPRGLLPGSGRARRPAPDRRRARRSRASGSWSSWSPTAARSAARRTSPSRRRPRSRRTCSASRCAPCSRASSRSCSTRSATRSRWTTRSAATREGRLTAVRARIVGDTGAYASVGAKVLERAAGHSCGPYRVPAVDVEAKTVYTNNPPSGAMRGFGVCQTAFAIEGCLDLLARAGRSRRLRHPRAQHPRPRRPFRHRPDHDRGLRHPADARGGTRRLQGERGPRRDRVRDQEHRHRQRARRHRPRADPGLPARAPRRADRLHRDGAGPVHDPAPGRERRRPESRPRR